MKHVEIRTESLKLAESDNIEAYFTIDNRSKGIGNEIKKCIG